MTGRVQSIIRGGADASPLERKLHQLYLALFLVGFAAANGYLALRLAACSYAPLYHPAVWASYFDHPPIVLLNVLPAIAFMALGYFLTRRAWAAYLISAVPTIGLALVNYYKIQLRGDPLLAADLRLVRTAGGILGHYRLDLSRVVLVAAGCAGLMLLYAIFLMPNGFRGKRLRLGGTLVCLALLPLLYAQVYMDNDIYYATVNNDAIENKWSDVEVFVSRGFWYPFVRSISKAFPTPPEGYGAREAEALLASYDGADISPEKRVHVVGVMLEAFADLSDFPMLAEQSGVAALYEPLHELEAQSVSGDLLTNIFAGGTVDSEWAFLTGYSHHSDFRGDVDSYVRYFKSQGYDAAYRHPGYGWFYNRRNVNGYLGFDESVFTENGFGALVDPEQAPKRSDAVLFDRLLSDLDARTAEQPPLFSFSVSYQNHGPYADDRKEYKTETISQRATGWSERSCNILNNYLDGVADTITELTRFVGELELLDDPVVLVAYGDHKPWLGNNESVYHEIGVDLDLETLDGFYNYYSTPYLIWANSAAKAALGNGFTGDGGDFSPCFLMPKLFDLCGWDGPAFLQLARDMRARSPLVHELGLFLIDGQLVEKSALPEEFLASYLQYRRAEYWRETSGLRQ
ncbi:MAG: LTA synthase family protein [Oscillospiraceae bacterium]|nr:LTA synthase family protein [Oscillospiraceae bacterium]